MCIHIYIVKDNITLKLKKKNVINIFMGQETFLRVKIIKTRSTKSLKIKHLKSEIHFKQNYTLFRNQFYKEIYSYQNARYMPPHNFTNCINLMT